MWPHGGKSERDVFKELKDIWYGWCLVGSGYQKTAEVQEGVWSAINTALEFWLLLMVIENHWSILSRSLMFIFGFRTGLWKHFFLREKWYLGFQATWCLFSVLNSAILVWKETQAIHKWMSMAVLQCNFVCEKGDQPTVLSLPAPSLGRFVCSKQNALKRSMRSTFLKKI